VQELSIDQKKALSHLIKWTKKTPTQYITLGGYAGTGKTTLIAILKKHLEEKKKMKIAMCSYTGKASFVLKSTLRKLGFLNKNDFVSTIHSLIYSPITNSKEEIIGWAKKEELKYDLIIIDEASMVSKEIWQDLLSFNIPLIAVGDHGQLPPINSEFNLLEKPLLKLEQVHRQAKENPIIEVSMLARTLGHIPTKAFSKNVMKINQKDPFASELIEEVLQKEKEDSLVLCGYNNTRIRLNKSIRTLRGFMEEEPEPGEKVICLRNNHKEGIYNGMLGTIKSIYPENTREYYAEIEMEDTQTTFKGAILKEQFNNPVSLNFSKERKKTLTSDLFDYGYALTVHKAQGSQAKTVVLFEERFSKMDENMWKRWLYTAVTRAQENLYIIG